MSAEMSDGRAVAANFSEDYQPEGHVRPQLLDDFVGQPGLRDNLRVFVEAARGLAVRLLQHDGGDDERLRLAFQICLAREPSGEEASVLHRLLRDQQRRFEDGDAVYSLLAVGDVPVPDDLCRQSLAAWAQVATVLLNLDETTTRG